MKFERTFDRIPHRASLFSRLREDGVRAAGHGGSRLTSEEEQPVVKTSSVCALVLAAATVVFAGQPTGQGEGLAGGGDRLHDPASPSAVVLAGSGSAVAVEGFVPAADARAAYVRAAEAIGAAGVRTAAETPQPSSDIPAEVLSGVVRRYCVVCHNDVLETGNLSLEGFDVAAVAERAEIGEKMITKLRAGMMPPPEMPRPGADTLLVLVQELEQRIDAAAAAEPNPGSRIFQRLNRAEYERSVRELLGLEIDASQLLPPDQRSANFDNIADAQLISPTLVSAYLSAASRISRLAVGDPDAAPGQTTYRVAAQQSQRERVEGAPVGTRGGISVVHTFPADGEYVFRMSFMHTVTGAHFGMTARHEQLEISIDGERVALLDVDQWMHEREAQGVHMETEPIFVRAGAHRVSAAFLKHAEGPVDDLKSPYEWSFADRHIGEGGYGVTVLPHLRDLSIGGPYNVTGISETETRRRIFTCRPTSPDEERPCAERIVGRLAEQAFRGLLEPSDVEGLLRLYESGAEEEGFEEGVRLALQGILASPKFAFRIERPAESVGPGEISLLSGEALASRLSYFLWNLPPDEELLDLARSGGLDDVRVLEEQAKRMLADPRSEALATRFAAQWLRLHDLDDINPDAFWFPDFDEALREAMRRETELFVHSLVQQDRSFLELLTADYTFLNERLARHYGVSGVVGSDFRRVSMPDPNRRGLLGHGSILTSTSFPNRTSVVDRGKWVLEVLLGTPPPPPPPNVPPLEDAESPEPGRILTSKEQLEIHRQNPVCASCHRFMDPIGLALENFDPTGRWRVAERRGMGNVPVPLDTRGRFWDGSPVESPSELRELLVQYRIPLTRTFTQNLMTYALGRRVEHYDQPTIRRIVSEAERDEYRMSSFILGVVRSDAFRMMRAPEVAADRMDSEGS